MKNIFKLIAVVALCFLIGGVLVACGDKGSSTAPYIGDDGNWYVDGKDTGISAQGPSGENLDEHCDPEDHVWSYYEYVKHTQTEDGKVIKACTECGYAVVGAETIHVWDEPNVYDATCEEAGWDGVKCSICGKNGEGKETDPALGHTWTEWKPAENDYEDICVDGGILVRHCETCLKTEGEPTDAIGHFSNNWVVEVNAGLGNTGLLKGDCVYCENNVEYILPVLNDTDYDVESVEAACTKDGSKTYVYVDEAAGVSYKYVQTLAAHGHLLNNKNYATFDIDNDNTNGVVLPFWYGEFDEEGRVPALGVHEFADETIACGTEGRAWFTCESCDEVVYVEAYKEHNGKATVTTAPSCIAIGYKDVDCDCCKNTIKNVKIDKLDHAWETELVRVGLTYSLVQNCTGNGLATDLCDATNILESGITDVVYEVKTPATCSSEGVGVYTYTKDGVTYPIEVSIPKTSHTLAGALANTLANTDGTFDHTIEGVKLFAGDVLPKCDSADPTIHGYYGCEVCSEVVYITIKSVHVKVNPVTTLNPTCTVPGVLTYTCENCQKPQTDPIPALGHSTVYELEHIEAGVAVDLDNDGINEVYYFILHTNCQRENCLAEDVEPMQYFVEAEEVDKKDPTCYAEGYITYAVEVGGVETPVTLPLGKVPHTLNGEYETAHHITVGNVTAIKSTVPGIHAFADESFVCGDVIHGYYECSVCKEAEQNETIVYVNVYQEHTLVLSGDNYVAPTCTEIGKAVCSHCASLGNNQLFDIPALGHKYEYVVKEIVDVNSVTLSRTCGNEGCTLDESSATFSLPVLADTRYTKVEVTPAVCLIAGVDHYTIGWNEVDGFVAADDKNSVVTIEFDAPSAPLVHDDYVPGVSLVLYITVDDRNAIYEVYVCNKCHGYVVLSITELN